MRVRIDTRYEGIGELLRSDEVQRDLDARASRVADAARSRGITVGGDTPLPITTESIGSRSRARAIVVADHEAGIAVESKHRLLVSSLDAAR